MVVVRHQQQVAVNTQGATSPKEASSSCFSLLKRYTIKAALSFGLVLFVSGSAWAQTIPDLINEPNLPLLRRLDVIPPEAFEEQPRSTDTDVKSQKDDKEAPEIDLDGAPNQPIPEGEEQKASKAPSTFMLKGVHLAGITVFKQNDLEPIISPYVNKEIAYGDLSKLADEITKLYRSNGYVTSKAFIPTQEVSDNMVAIQVVEGKVGDISIEGNKRLRDSYIRSRIPLEPGEILRIQALEEHVLKLNQDPLVKELRINLAPGKAFGTSNVQLKVKDNRRTHLTLSFDNQGRKLIGFYRYNAQFRNDNVLGFGDNLFVQGTLSNNYNTRSVFAQYKFPLNKKGWSVGANYALGAVDIGGYLEPVGIHNQNNRESIFTEFPILRKKNLTIDMNANLTALQSITTLNRYPLKNFIKSPPDSQQSVGFGANLVHQDKWGRTIVRASSEIGIAWMGGNLRYSKYTADVMRVQRVWKDIIAVARTNAQWSPQPLSSLVQYQAGGANTVRGSLEGQYIGDKGYTGSVELRSPLYGLPDVIKKRWQAIFFVDHGGVYTNLKDNGEGAGGSPGHLVSYGAGLRGSFSRFLQAAIDFAFVGSPRKEEPTARIHFSLSSQLF